MYNKSLLLAKAIEILKEYARGGGSIAPDHALEIIYRKLEKLNEEIDE